MSQSKDNPGKVAISARGQINKGKLIYTCPRSRLKNGFHETNSAIPSRPASACSFSILGLNLVLTNDIPPDFRCGVHLSISIHAIGQSRV